MKLTIRAATDSDYASLCRLFDELDALHREALPWMFREPAGAARDRADILDLIAHESTTLFMAQVDERPAGLITVMVRESPEKAIFVPRRFAVVDNLMVKREFQRRGIGRALMEKAHEWAAAQGVDEIQLSVWEFNREAMEFYAALGYTPISRKMNKRLR